MNDLLRQVDRIPVTLVIAIAYGTLFVLTHVVAGDDDTIERLTAYGLLRPIWVVDGEPWRLVAAAFLHANLLHIGLNMLGLLALGPSLEQSLGSLRFALLYVVAGLGGNIAVCLLYPPAGAVLGGSGALFGMMGAIVAINMRAGRHLFSFLEFEGPRRMLGLIAINIVIGFVIPIVSNTAHIGGLIGGFLVTFLWLMPGRRPSRAQRRWAAAFSTLFATLLLWCLEPATRWDHSWIRAESATGDAAAALRHAAMMDLEGRPDVTPLQARLLAGSLDSEIAEIRDR